MTSKGSSPITLWGAGNSLSVGAELLPSLSLFCFVLTMLGLHCNAQAFSSFSSMACGILVPCVSCIGRWILTRQGSPSNLSFITTLSISRHHH